MRNLTPLFDLLTFQLNLLNAAGLILDARVVDFEIGILLLHSKLPINVHVFI